MKTQIIDFKIIGALGYKHTRLVLRSEW